MKVMNKDSSFDEYFSACILGKREGVESNLMFELFDLSRLALQTDDTDRVRACKDEIGGILRGFVNDRKNNSCNSNELYSFLDASVKLLQGKLRSFACLVFSESQVNYYMVKVSNKIFNFFYSPMCEWVRNNYGGEEKKLIVI